MAATQKKKDKDKDRRSHPKMRWIVNNDVGADRSPRREFVRLLRRVKSCTAVGHVRRTRFHVQRISDKLQQSRHGADQGTRGSRKISTNLLHKTTAKTF